jgi:excisionase family DNA binding protein
LSGPAAILHGDTPTRPNGASGEDQDDPIVVLRPRVLRKLEAAKYLGVSRATVDRMLAAGEIEAKASRGLVLVTVASLDAYLDSLPNARAAKEQ